MKPFNLEKALAGEPVKVRDGSKAYVLYESNNLANKYTTRYLIGYISRENAQYKQEDYPMTWTKDGRTELICKTQDDIVGMWEEPPKPIKIGNFEFPRPESEVLEKETRFFIPLANSLIGVSQEFWYDNDYCNLLLESGLIHLTREAAEQHAKVLIAISQGKTSLV